MSGVKGRSGGKRRRHIPPALSWADVTMARALRAQGDGYKSLCRLFEVGRRTMHDVIHHRGAYADPSA